ncbi:MAG: RNA 2',3'-cyclic phosphodiesterase [Deltaproteobacteria bacterium]
MRTFIAIALPPSIHAYLKGIQDTLKKAEADVKWVEPANIHLTLKFLGEIDGPTVEKVKGAMADAAAGVARFQMGLSALGGFPTSTSPRVVWMGIKEGIAPLKDLASRLEERLAPMGLAEDRPFAAHITLGRTRSSRNRRQLAESLQQPPAQLPAPFEVAGVTLFKSTLSPKGPAYEALSLSPLGDLGA